ncbi:cardiolipin synthase [Massilibacterium senegalense]|uniref:cardiolipin synthase n=1 Tax=Massilibacterium senegalense TaxID=1632858 RepID=UPI000781BC10|nr:cardiolipin synthase [Massilibacterium senegalense]
MTHTPFSLDLSGVNSKKTVFFTKHSGTISFITTGNQLMKNLQNDLLCATSSIDMLFYIVRNDTYGDKIIDLLLKKAQQGVQVRLLLDWVGSIFIHRSTIRRLQKGGVNVCFSNKSFFSIQQRNHRKITVIDQQIGYLGGFNIGKEYVSQTAIYGYWRDFHLRFEGDGVCTLHKQFMDDWSSANKKEFSPTTNTPNLKKGNLNFSLIGTNGEIVEDIYLSLFQQASQEIIIATPYFIPTKRLLDALMDACRKRIRVIIVVPYRNDHPLVGDVANIYFQPLLKSGAKIYRFIPGFYHTKATVIDRKICNVGTSNFDRRSFFLNAEMNCIIEDEPFAKQVAAAIQKDCDFSEPLTLDILQNKTPFQKTKQTVGKWIEKYL